MGWLLVLGLKEALVEFASVWSHTNLEEEQQQNIPMLL